MTISLVMPVGARLAALRTLPADMMCSRQAPDPRILNQRIVNETDPLEVLRLYDEYGHAYKEINLATTWSRLGRARSRSRDLIRLQNGKRLHALRTRTVQEAERWKARPLANTALALAKLQLRSGGWKEL
jgi:hypothetical protein